MEEKNTLGRPLTVDDPELFARVWRRVMPEEELSPIALGPAPGAQGEEPARPEGDPSAAEGTPSRPGNGPAGTERAPARQAGAPPTEAEEELCLGDGSLPFVAVLERRMEQAQQGAQIYQALARRAQGSAGRQIAALAADQQRHLRRLGAAYFLLTGRRWQSCARAALPAGGTAGALREMFAWEQQVRQGDLKAGRQTKDPCLQGLFQELADEAQLHMDAIRHILERPWG